jgi:hypothetical protein
MVAFFSIASRGRLIDYRKFRPKVALIVAIGDAVIKLPSADRCGLPIGSAMVAPARQCSRQWLTPRSSFLP